MSKQLNSLKEKDRPKVTKEDGIRGVVFRALVFLVLAGATVFFCLNAPEGAKGNSVGLKIRTSTDENVTSSKVLGETLPESVDGFTSDPSEASDVEKNKLQGAEFENRDYWRPDLGFLRLGIVLSGADRRNIHPPEICFPGQGYTILESEYRDILLDNGETLSATVLDVRRPIIQADGSILETRFYYYYWFVGADITTPKHSQRVLYTSLDNVLQGTNHRWAYVSASKTIDEGHLKNGRSAADTKTLIDEFLSEAVPKFQTTFKSERTWSKFVPFL